MVQRKVCPKGTAPTFVPNVDLPFEMIRNSYSTIHMKPFASCFEFCCSTCMARRRRNASPPKGLRWDSPGKRKVEFKKTKTTSLLHLLTLFVCFRGMKFKRVDVQYLKTMIITLYN